MVILGAWGTSAAAGAARVCPGPVTTGGADVSSYNVEVDFRAFKRGGRGFVFIKATEGLSLRNPRFARDWAAARAAGLVRGAYHFFHPDRDPKLAAEFFVRTVGPFGPGDLAPVFDWERSANRSPGEQIAAARTWLTEVERLTGRRPIIYTAPTFFDALGNPAEFSRYPLFVAEYNVSCPRPPRPWTTWTFWQFAATGSVPGIAGSVVDQDLYDGAWPSLLDIAK